MRRALVLFGVTALLIASATPASAASEDDLSDLIHRPFSISPVAGPPGTRITVRGHCPRGAGAGVQLRRPVRQGIIESIDERWITNGVYGEFETELLNRLPEAADDPTDLEVVVYCNLNEGHADPVASFVSTRRSTIVPTRVFVTLGDGPCGINDLACPAHVRGFTPSGEVGKTNYFVPYLGHVRGSSVAVGDLDGDGVDEVAVGAGPGGPSSVRLHTLTGAAVRGSESGGLNSFGWQFEGGINVAFGDVDGDGADELIQAADSGGGPHVIVERLSERMGAGIDDSGSRPTPSCADCAPPPPFASFFAYDPAFRGGVTVAAADLDGDGRDEIITGAGAGGAPHVRVFRGDGTPVGNGFLAYDPGYLGGVTVAAGHVAGNRSADIVTGTRHGAGPHVRVFDARGVPAGPGFFAYDAAFRGGVAVAVGDASSAAHDEIVTVPYAGAPVHVRVFDSSEGDTFGAGFYAFTPASTGGRVAVTR